MTKSALAAEAGVNRDTVAAIESGKGFQPSTLGRILAALDRVEGEAGFDAAPSADPKLVTFTVSGMDGFSFTVEGPVSDIVALKDAARELVEAAQNGSRQGARSAGSQT